MRCVFQYNWHCVSVLNFFSCYFLFILLLSAWHSYILYNLRKVCATYQTTSRWEERDGVVLYWHKNGMKEITTQKERIYKKKKKTRAFALSFFFPRRFSFLLLCHPQLLIDTHLSSALFYVRTACEVEKVVIFFLLFFYTTQTRARVYIHIG